MADVNSEGSKTGDGERSNSPPKAQEILKLRQPVGLKVDNGAEFCSLKKKV